jgi:hypothetical protein
MRGLVLLDLPDMDSLATGNRIEADRLVGLADRVVWVLDPQKYADASVHEQYLRHMGALRDVTIVVFNQSDRLSFSDADRCRTDLARLVAADGLPGIPVIGTSTATGEGIDELRKMLEEVVADRHAAAVRIEAELAACVQALTPLAAVPGPGEDEVSRDAVPVLATQLAQACGVDALAADAGLAYRSRSVLWQAPWHRSVWPVIPPADPAAVSVALRALASRVGDLLPEPWPRHLRAAATAGRERLPSLLADALDSARGASPVPPQWIVARWVWWLSLPLCVVALLRDLPTLGLVLAGMAAALPLLAAATGTWRAMRHRRMVARRLRLAVLGVAREVVAPVRTVLRDYAQAHDWIAEARPPDSRFWSYAHGLISNHG